MWKRSAAAAVTVLTVLATGSASAAELVPRPARDDSRVIATAGTYSQEQADANRAAYLQLQDYTDQQAALDASVMDGLRSNMYALIDDVHAKNAQIDLMGTQIVALRGQVAVGQATIEALKVTVAKRDAKIRHLRKVIRSLRD